MLLPRQERKIQSKRKGLGANRRKKAQQRARCSNTSMSQLAVGGMGVSVTGSFWLTVNGTKILCLNP